MENCIFRKGLVFGILSLLFGLSAIPSIGGTILDKKSNYPISNGNTLYVGGTGPNNYTMIQDAIDNASNGDTVFVYSYSSPYYEKIDIDETINLVGQDRETTVIDGNNGWLIIDIRADWVTVSGFTIKNSHEFSTGIYIGSISSHITIKDNIIHNNGEGIAISWYSNNNNISGNNITSNGYGIELDRSSGNTIIGNNFLNNFGGIIVYPDANNNIISNNIISNNGYDNRGFGISIGTSNYNLISENTIIFNHNYGIHIWMSSNNNTVSGNTISSNYGDGIFLDNNRLFSDNNIINGNDISSNKDIGINITLSSKNTISENNFRNNKRSSYFIDSKNIWKHNYWGRPRILPKLIFGVIKIDSKWIPWINIDWRPALRPYDI